MQHTLFKMVTPKELVTLFLSALVLVLLSILTAPSSTPFASVEVEFTDASAQGLAIVPASCPSSPHYSGDCSVDNDGSGPGVCVPSNACLSGNVINSCTGVVTQACQYGCSGGACLPPAPPSYTGFTATLVSSSSGGGSSTGPGGVVSTFEATGHLQLRPTLLRSGERTQIYWNVSNAASCSVSTASNTDRWTTVSSGLTGATSSPIVGQTTYTLSCTSIAGATPASIQETQTVNVIPVFQEQ